MNVEDIAREIARISPAAGREADKLVAEIKRLSSLAEYPVKPGVSMEQLQEERLRAVRVLQTWVLGHILRAIDPETPAVIPDVEDNDEFTEKFMKAVEIVRDNREQKSRFAQKIASETKIILAEYVWHLFEISAPPIKDADDFWNMAMERVRETLPKSRERFKDRLRKAAEERLAERTSAIAQELSASLGGSRERPESFTSDMEWLSGLFAAAAEIRAAQTAAPVDAHELQTLQVQLDQHSTALTAVHSEMLQMQELYLGERRKANDLRRKLRTALADIEFHKGSAEDAGRRLQVVDMALRGQAPSIEASAPYRTPTFDLAARIHTDLGNAIQMAEREAGWRREAEQSLTELQATKMTPVETFLSNWVAPAEAQVAGEWKSLQPDGALTEVGDDVPQ